jgi:hypothetical protein
MVTRYNYTGCFLDPASCDILKSKRLGKPLANQNEIFHMTILFHPENPDETLFGEIITMRVVGYGIDNENEGFLVEAFSDDPELQKLIDARDVLHITMSISENGKHRNTRNLHFEPIEVFEISGRYGGYVRTGERDGYIVMHSASTEETHD